MALIRVRAIFWRSTRSRTGLPIILYTDQVELRQSGSSVETKRQKQTVPSRFKAWFLAIGTLRLRVRILLEAWILVDVILCCAALCKQRPCDESIPTPQSKESYWNLRFKISLTEWETQRASYEHAFKILQKTSYSEVFLGAMMSSHFRCRGHHLSGVGHAGLRTGLPELHLDSSRGAHDRGRTITVWTFERFFTMMTYGSNGHFRASETEDEEGVSGVRMVGRPAPGGAGPLVLVQRHKLWAIHERIPHETTSSRGRALHFPVCNLFSGTA